MFDIQSLVNISTVGLWVDHEFSSLAASLMLAVSESHLCVIPLSGSLTAMDARRHVFGRSACLLIDKGSGE